MPEKFESRVFEIGQWLHGLMGNEVPPLFDKASWPGKIIDLCLRKEGFKRSLLRFIDVLPYLNGSVEVARHLSEYFNPFKEKIPKDLGLIPDGVAPHSKMGRKTGLEIAARFEGMMRVFIAGTNPDEALPILNDLRSRKMALSVDLLGEAVVSEREAEEYVERYLDILDCLNEAHKTWAPIGVSKGDLDWGHAPKVNISIKPSAMYSQMHPKAFEHSLSRSKEHLRPIFRKAVEMGAQICLDMEQHHLKNLTLALYRSLLEDPEFSGYAHTGTVIQTYLHDSGKDLFELVEWAKKREQRISVRLVKGAYWEAEIVQAKQANWPIPFYRDKNQTDANFEKQARYLMENHKWIKLACASQNIRSIAYMMALSKELEVPPEDLEYQVLYGMAEPIQDALQKAGVPLRIYTPIGEMIPGMAYLIRRLLETTSKESFLRQNFSEGVAFEQQLRNPLETASPANTPSKPDIEKTETETLSPFRNEPALDWSISENRNRFKKALKKVRKAFPNKIPLFINGKKVTTEKAIRSSNPNDPEELVGIVSSAGEEEADMAIEAARKAFPAWRDRDPKVRAQYLFNAASIAREMRYDLAALQVYEVGKSWSEADADVCEAIDFMEYYGREMIRLSKPQRMGHVPGEESFLFYEPQGVAAVLAPWNFPLAISMGMTSAALVTGNTVVYKPSSNSVVMGSMVYNIFKKAKLPKGVLNFIPASGDEIGDRLVTHPQVDLIAFTGSRNVGLRIIELAGKTPEGAGQVKTVVAEMGGKNAIIVDADADIGGAIGHILHSAFGYQGQKCSACSRLIVLAQVHDKLIARLKKAAESIEMGPTENPQAMVGAVIDAAARNKILEYVEIGEREGKLLLKREMPEVKGHVVPLAIFTDIRPEHRLAQEEIFGPILSIIKVKDFEEALDVANSTPYALTGSLLSRSPNNIAEAQKKFRVGNLYVNRGCTGAVVGRHPFGGFKMSGVGSKAGGPDYLLQFMVPRAITENTLRRGFAPDLTVTY